MTEPLDYKGWTITPAEGTQVGYRTSKGSGRGRKIKGYHVAHPEHRPEPKWCDTRAQAREYVDSWDTTAPYVDCLRSTLVAGNGPWDPRWLTFSRSTISPTIAECLRSLGANKLAAQPQVTRAELEAVLNGGAA